MSLRRLLLKPAQVAEELGVTVWTLARWRVQGKGPRFVKVNRAIRYERSDVDAVIDARKRCSTSDVEESAAQSAH